METLTHAMNSTAALVAAIGTFLAGVAAIGIELPRKRQKMGLAFWFGIILLSLSVATFSFRTFVPDYRSLNEKLTTQAWDALNGNNYVKATEYASSCVDEFRGQADRKERELEQSSVPLPPTGKASDRERDEVLVRGVLNDVASCFYIKGRADESLGNKKEAEEAYKQASTYRYARTWDPKGWFWAPAEAASDRLEFLKK